MSFGLNVGYFEDKAENGFWVLSTWISIMYE